MFARKDTATFQVLDSRLGLNQHNVCAECRFSFVVMLRVIMQNVIMLCVVALLPF